MNESDIAASTPSVGNRNNIPVRARPRNLAIPLAPSVRARQATTAVGAPKALQPMVWARIVAPEFMDFSFATEEALQSIANMGHETPVDFLMILDRQIGQLKNRIDETDAGNPATLKENTIKLCGLLIARAIVFAAWHEALENDPVNGEEWTVAF